MNEENFDYRLIDFFWPKGTVESKRGIHSAAFSSPMTLGHSAKSTSQKGLFIIEKYVKIFYQGMFSNIFQEYYVLL